ncbi:MAG: ATP-binding protein [Bdellovibrionota bacterium]
MQGSKKPRVGSRIIRGIVAIILAVSAGSFYTVWRIESVQKNVELLNQFYVPALKHLNLLGGKWSAYQRAFEQYVGFRKWGLITHEHLGPKLHLRKMVEGNLTDLNRLLEQLPQTHSVPEKAAIQNWNDDLARLAEGEPVMLATISTTVKMKRYSEAAEAYAKARQDHLRLSQNLSNLTREIENRVTLLQLTTEQELRSSQSMMIVLLGFSLVFSIIVFFRVRQWIMPIAEWTKVAQEIALKGLHRDVEFPRITKDHPPELSLLTREFTRMGMTVLERERTIHQQKDKLESLNHHLKDQNEMLRRLGSLNERILNSMSSALLVLNANGQVEQFNDRFCDLFGVERGQLLGKKAHQVLSAWPEPKVQDWLEATDPLSSQREVLGRKVFHVQIQPLYDGQGKLLSFEDITFRVEAEERLEHAKKLILAGNLSSQVAHEVRNPLNSMSLQLEMLREDLGGITQGSQQKHAVESRVDAIDEQVQRLDRITQRYLDVRALQVERSEKVELHQLIERSIAFLSREIQAAGVQVELNLSAENAVIGADRDALAQVLFNLIRNSIEAMRDKKGDRRLTLTSFERNEALFLRIEDTGGGVSSEVRGRLFEPFVTTKVSGHGLGLTVSRQICLQHGGKLDYVDSVDSSHGGAIFEVSIPLAKKEDQPHATDLGC